MDEVCYMKFKHIISLLGLLLISMNSYAETGNPKVIGPALVYSMQGDFGFVRDDLEAAIVGRGMVVTFVSHVSDMLARTAEVAGVSKAVYGKAEVLFFCKADLAHRQAAGNPHNIAICPYSIAVYTLTDDKKTDDMKTVYLSTRQPVNEDENYKPVFRLIKELILEAIEG